MSRIGKQKINIPSGVTVEVKGIDVCVSGPRGALSRPLHKNVTLSIEENTVSVAISSSNNPKDRALWGTFASHVKNMIEGVTKGFEKRLVIEGIGYKAQAGKDALTLNLGFSHPVVLPIPQGISIVSDKEGLTVSGNDKEAVGHFAALVRALKKPEPYKGKGIRYKNEIIRRKQGKRAAASA